METNELGNDVRYFNHSYFSLYFYAIQLAAVDILRVNFIPSCSIIEELEKQTFTCCYIGHDLRFGSSKCSIQKRHLSLCDALSWREFWLTITTLQRDLDFDKYSLPLQILFKTVKDNCDLNEIFAHTTQVRVDLSVTGHLEEEGGKYSHDIGLDLLEDLLIIEHENAIVKVISSFMFKEEVKQKRLVFALKILFLDNANLKEELTPSSRSQNLVNKMADLFIRHFKDGKLVLNQIHLSEAFELKRAGRCINFKCDSTYGEVEYPAFPATTQTTRKSVEPHKSSSVKKSPWVNFAFLLPISYVVYTMLG